MAKKSTKGQLIRRRDEVQEMIVQGHGPAYIIDTLSQKWDTSRRAIEEDMRFIAKQWQTRVEENRHLAKNKFLDRLETLFCHALAEKQYKTALDIQKEINKLYGLHATEEHREEMPKIINITKKSNKLVGSGEES